MLVVSHHRQCDGTLNPVFTQAGIDALNDAALKCFSREPDCPTGRLAIVLNGTVASAPTIQTAEFERDQIVISGDFTFPEAVEISAQLSDDASAISFQPVIRPTPTYKNKSTCSRPDPRPEVARNVAGSVCESAPTDRVDGSPSLPKPIEA